MATIYVRSTDGSNSDDGSTWALAKADLAGAAAIDSAGDTFYVSGSHAESGVAAVTLGLAGTYAGPIKILCVDDSAEPPTTLATTGSVTVTGNSFYTFSGSVYCYGLIFEIGTSTNTQYFGTTATGTHVCMMESCKIRINMTGASARIRIGGDGSITRTQTIFRDVDVKFAATGQGIVFNNGEFLWDGGSYESGTSATTSVLYVGSARGSRAIITGVDFSNLGTGLTLVNCTTNEAMLAVFRNCKLPASWVGGLWSTVPTSPGGRVEMHNCDSGDTNYRLWVEDGAGSCKHETTIVRAGARTDGTTNVTWKIVTTANAKFPMVPFKCPEIRIWNETVGSVTVKIPFVHDDATDAKTNELGMDVWYAGTSGVPLYLLATTDESVLASAANHADATSDDNWGTTGFTNENEQRMSLTFTTAEKGWIIIVPKVYEASKTLYIDPDPQIS